MDENDIDENNSYPFPPRYNKRFWNEQSLTYDEAKQAFHAQSEIDQKMGRTPLNNSFRATSQSSENVCYPFPPKHSMTWEGENNQYGVTYDEAVALYEHNKEKQVDPLLARNPLVAKSPRNPKGSDSQLNTLNRENSINQPLSNASLQSENLETPIVNMERDRIQSIINDTPAIFEIKENDNVDGSKPFFESSLLNPIDSGVIYNKMGAKYGVDPGWLKAIAYMENTHGFYDGLPPLNLVNSSYRPMNVQYRTWKPLADQLGFSEWQVQYRVECNVELAALIIKRITDRVPNPTLEKVASIYNFTGAELTRDYGARVKKIYEERLWEK